MALCPNGVIIMKSSLVSSPTLSRVSHSPSSLSCSSFSLMSMSSVPPRKRRRIIEGSSCTTFLSSSGTSGIGDTRDNNTNGSYSLLEKLFQRTDQPAYYSFTTSSNTCRTDRSYSVDHTSTPEVIPLSFLSRKRAVSSFLEDRILGQLVTQPQLRRENSSLILDRSISSIEETYECPDIPMPSSGSSSNVGVSGDCSRSASVSNGSRNGDNNNKLQRTPMCARCRNHNIETRVKGELQLVFCHRNRCYTQTSSF